MRTAGFLLRISSVPLAAVLGAVLAVLTLERAVPERLVLDIESASARSVSIVGFPRSRDQPVDGFVHALPVGQRKTLSARLNPRVEGVGVTLGSDPGWVRVHGARIARLLTWAAWTGQDLSGWKAKSGISVERAGSAGLTLELSGESPGVLAIVGLDEKLQPVARRERAWVAVLGGLLSAVLALGPARRAWRLGSLNQRRLAAVYAALLIMVLALIPLARDRFLKRGQRSGYLDPTGDYDFSFLDHSGRRVSHQIGRLGLVLDPFSFYRNYPVQRNSSFSIDEHGFRGGLPDSDKPLAFILGGSTVFGFGLSDDGEAISARLGDHLQDLAVANAGVSGYASGQELAQLIGHLDRWRPALYVVLDGWNDLLEAVYYPERSPELRPFPVLGINGQYFWMEQFLHEHARATYAGDLPAWTGAPLVVDRSLADRFEEALERYVINVERMATWARAREAAFLVVLQPEKGAKRSPTVEERRAPTASAEVSAFYRRFVELAVQRFEDLGIPHASLLDRAEIVDSTEELFLDPCHLTPRGCDLVAQVLAGEIETLLASGATARHVEPAGTPGRKH